MKSYTKIFLFSKGNKNIISETTSFYILLAFLLITIALLIAVSIYCYRIKYKSVQKHLLSFYIKNNKSIITYYNNGK